MIEIKKNSKEYPKRLLEIKNPPDKLYAEGNIELLNKTSIAIVGTRECTEYGIQQAKRFASNLAQRDICIVSGLARGIDTIAHIFSKDKIGKTIAVIASGFNNIYPTENKRLYEQIISEGGCIISEWPPETEVDMHRFPKRNRIISGISIGTLVVQAKYRSGSTITAHYAMKQGREVFCIPGNLDEKESYGTNKLIEENANLVVSPQDIVDILELDGIKLESKTSKLFVEDEYREVYDNIGTMPITPNEIVKITKKNIAEVNEILFMLEVDNLIKSLPGNRYVINELK